MNRNPAKRAVRSVAGAILLSAVALAPARAVEPVAHEARYDLSLLELRNADEGSVGGLFLAKLSRTCDGWTVVTRMHVVVETEEGTVTVDSSTTYNETMAGTAGTARLDFESEQRLNGNRISHRQGTAERGPEGARVTFTRPEKNRLPLPGDVVFPVDASLRALAVLFEKGEMMIAQPAFDGASDEAVRIVDLAAGTPEPPETAVEGDAHLLQGAMKRVVTAYFPLGAADSEPLSTYVSDLYANGVAAGLSIDVGLAVVDADLSAIRAIPEPEC